MFQFVPADWVAERLGTPEFLVIDTRFSMRHLMGHLRSAVNVPPPKLRGATGKLLPAEDLARLFGGVGLGDRVTPVLYDGYDGRNVALIAWVLEYLGRDDVHIMDIVFDEWKSQGREVLYRPVLNVPTVFTPKINPEVRATLDEVSNDRELVLVDTRSEAEYRGETEADQKPGHIPGAVNIVWQELVGQNGQLVCSEEKAREVFEGANVDKDDQVVAYCKVGARAAVGYLAFKRLGYSVRLFDGSYAEWEQSGLPVEL